MERLFEIDNNVGSIDKLQYLRETMHDLKSKVEHVRTQMENEEIQATKRQRSEVSEWIQQVNIMEEKLQSIETDVDESGHSGVEEKLDRMIETVKLLVEQSEFPNGLFLDDLNPEGVEYIIPEWSKAPTRIQQVVLEMQNDLVGLIREGSVHPYISFPNLEKIELRDCGKVKKLWVLNIGLPNIVEIVVEHCPQIEDVFATEQGAQTILPKLRSVKLSNLPELKNIINDNVLCPAIAKLQVKSCNKVKKLLLLNTGVANVEEIVVESCEQMESIFATEQGASTKLPRLRSVKLTCLPKLTSIYNEGVFCSGVVKLHVRNCDKMKKLWLLNVDLPILDEIVVENCQEMEEIFATEQGASTKFARMHTVQLASLPKLRSIYNEGVFCSIIVKLHVRDCNKMKKLWLLNKDLPLLDEIVVERCQQMEEIFATEEGTPTKSLSLHTVKLTDLPELRSIYNDSVFCSRVVKLHARRCDKMKKLWLLNMDLRILDEIVVESCEQMEEIFATEEGAPTKSLRLRSVQLTDLPNLRSIYNDNVLCPGVLNLRVRSCNKLKKLCW